MAASSLLLFRSRGDIHDRPAVGGAHRRAAREHGGLLLARREILVDESVLRTQNLAVFL